MNEAVAYRVPATLDDALGLLAGHGGAAQVLAGGQTLVPALWRGEISPALLVDLRGIEGLREICCGERAVWIGAMVTFAAAIESARLAAELPEVLEAMRFVGTVPIRHRATFGGTLALANPHAELITCLVALEGRVTIASPTGHRELAAGEFLVAPWRSALGPGEIVTGLSLPRRERGEAHGFAEITLRRSGGLARALAFARQGPDGARAVTIAGEIGLPRTIPVIVSSEQSAEHGEEWLGLAEGGMAARLAAAAASRALGRLRTGTAAA
jgi:carbon-monoxide dehydrogenase medium subunit